MNAKVVGEADIMREAAAILMEHMSPTKVARFWAGWQIGQGDYLLWRDEEFGDQSVDELYDQIAEFQDASSSS